MKKQLIYRKLAKYYDLLYLWKDYKEEAGRLKKLILKYKNSRGQKLLDVACGTGMHLKYLKKDFSCMGTDTNEGMLRVARKNIKGVTFKKANMISLNLNKKFDIITCLFSSIGYVKTYLNLRKTINNLAKHLKPGGILIIEPWFTKRIYKVGLPHMTTYNGENVKIARLNTSKRKRNISYMTMHYLIAEKNKDVKYFVDRHELGLFERNKTLEILGKAGFEAWFIEKGFKQTLKMKSRGLYIGIKNKYEK